MEIGSDQVIASVNALSQNFLREMPGETRVFGDLCLAGDQDLEVIAKREAKGDC